MNDQRLINEIHRLREALRYIQDGKNLEYINSYGRAQPDFPLRDHEMRQKARDTLTHTPVTSMQAEQLALEYTMKGHGRYLECLRGVVYLYSHLMPHSFVSSVLEDYNSYEEKMKKAELPVKFITSFDEKAE